MRFILPVASCLALLSSVACQDTTSSDMDATTQTRIDRVEFTDAASGQVHTTTFTFLADGMVVKDSDAGGALQSRGPVIRGTRTAPPEPNNDGGYNYTCESNPDEICYDRNNPTDDPEPENGYGG